MASLFKARTISSKAPTGAEAIAQPPTADHGVQPGRYLTDGVILYRMLDRVASSRGEMVALEDCRSLEVSWWTRRELRDQRLRAVIPAGAR